MSRALEDCVSAFGKVYAASDKGAARQLRAGTAVVQEEMEERVLEDEVSAFGRVYTVPAKGEARQLKAGTAVVHGERSWVAVCTQGPGWKKKAARPKRPYPGCPGRGRRRVAAQRGCTGLV